MEAVRSTGANIYCQKRHAPIPPAAAGEPNICTCSIMLFAVGMAPSTRNTSQNAGLEGTAAAGSVALSPRKIPTFSRGIAASRTAAMDSAVRLSHNECSGPCASEAPNMMMTCGMAAPEMMSAASTRTNSAPPGSNMAARSGGVTPTTMPKIDAMTLLFTAGARVAATRRRNRGRRDTVVAVAVRSSRLAAAAGSRLGCCC
mmetsp:Transcript_29000/g.46517  ORF Transcript_29000/g.46517 Transcript_29000/m.46517 type:complete len:201 (+) Transcript_29000:495-1097(+)